MQKCTKFQETVCIQDIKIVPNTLRIKDVIGEYLQRQRRNSPPVASMINHVIKGEPTAEDFQKLFDEFSHL